MLPLRCGRHLPSTALLWPSGAAPERECAEGKSLEELLRERAGPLPLTLSFILVRYWVSLFLICSAQYAIPSVADIRRKRERESVCVCVW
jgi:hypothetical protein